MNKNIKYDLFFEGEILDQNECTDKDGVQLNIISVLNLQVDKKEEFFSGKRIYIRRNCTYKEGIKELKRLEKLKMKVYLVEIIGEIDERTLLEKAYSRESNTNDVERESVNFISKIWSFNNGRMNRKNFIIGFSISYMIYVFLLGHSLLNMSRVGVIPMSIGFIACIYIFKYSANRLRDIGFTGWFSLLLLIPYVKFLLILFLAVAPGVVGSNRYGKMN